MWLRIDVGIKFNPYCKKGRPFSKRNREENDEYDIAIHLTDLIIYYLVFLNNQLWSNVYKSLMVLPLCVLSDKHIPLDMHMSLLGMSWFSYLYALVDWTVLPTGVASPTPL